jgi:hypothetical protein
MGDGRKKRMAKSTKLPRIIELSDGRHAVEIAPGCYIVWWCEGDLWTVKLEGPVETGLDLRNIAVEPAH